MPLNLPETFKYEKRGAIAVMTLNNPKAMNALTTAMLKAMMAAFDDFNADPELRVAILTGTGDGAFCAGLDLKDTMAALTSGDTLGFDDPAMRPWQHIFKPIIAAVNGLCIAGGMEFMEGTDIRIATENAIFGLGEVRWGVIPMGGTHIRLPQQIPYAVAMEMLLTGTNISAQRAYEIGLINKVVPQGKLMDEALALAEKIALNGPLAVRTAKEIVVRALNNEPGFVLEKSMGARVFQSEDAKEGPRAFAEKRKPKFTGH
ncbi:MAG: enoyl-CoA hydratase/isomerase family protein [Rhodocyclales bacterium]|nr:enoyl-CoA hydratase/isomerase family protein [Rhodocyclales bacterium]